MCGNSGQAKKLDSFSTYHSYPSSVELSSKYALYKVQQPTGTRLVVARHAQVTYTETTLEE